MAEPNQPEGMTAVLLQLSALTQRLAEVEHRCAGQIRDTKERAAALAQAVEQVRAAADGHTDALAALDGLAAQVAGLAARIDQLAPPAGESGSGQGYQPTPPPKLWKSDDRDREQVAGKLRAWIEQVYRPGYGHLAAGLGPCWDQHPLCLYIVDWLSELWSVLYLAPARTQAILAGQAEWHTRLLPAAADQLVRETRGCAQHAGRRPAPGPLGVRP